MILHDWNLEKKKHLIRAAYNALSENCVFITVENIIDDERRENAFGLLMSLNMLIEFGDAFDFSGADFWSWCQEAGFKSTKSSTWPAPAAQRPRISRVITNRIEDYQPKGITIKPILTLSELDKEDRPRSRRSLDSRKHTDASQISEGIVIFCPM